jgi:hypothetical protein
MVSSGTRKGVQTDGMYPAAEQCLICKRARKSPGRGAPGFWVLDMARVPRAWGARRGRASRARSTCRERVTSRTSQLRGIARGTVARRGCGTTRRSRTASGGRRRKASRARVRVAVARRRGRGAWRAVEQRVALRSPTCTGFRACGRSRSAGEARGWRGRWRSRPAPRRAGAGCRGRGPS